MRLYLVVFLLIVFSFFAGVMYEHHQILKGFWFAFNETGTAVTSESYQVYDRDGTFLYSK